MPTKRDYYEVLGVARSATADEIRKAYRRLARTHHPDVSSDTDAPKRFAEVSEAYEVLNDAEKRRAYDQFGHAGVAAGASGFNPAWSTAGGRGGGTGAGFDPSDFGSIFEEMFGATPGQSPFGADFGHQKGGAHRPRRGTDIEHTVKVSFMTAALGGEEPIRMSSGAGAKTQTVKVKIPRGVDSGAKLRVKGKGHPSPQGGSAGDLILELDVGAHPLFRREGLDLVVDVPVNIAEAALGTTVDVPLLNGTAEIKIPPGASSGTRLRIKGKGLQDAGGKKGNFYAVVQIVAPAELSDDIRAQLEALRPELKNPRESGPWADVGERAG